MALRNFVKYALILCLLLSIGAAGVSKRTLKKQVEFAQLYLPVDLSDTQVQWINCGTWNGMYWHAFNLIQLCNENLKEGLGLARFIFLHELGHKYTFSREKTYERWKGNYEAAADEFAAIMSIVQGNPRDLLQTAMVYREWGRDHPHNPADPHPSMEDRAAMLENIFKSYLSGVGDHYRDAMRYWRKQFMTEA